LRASGTSMSVLKWLGLLFVSYCSYVFGTALTLMQQGLFVKYIQQETGTRVQIKGIGSGFVDQETGRESDEPMHIHITYAFSPPTSSAQQLTHFSLTQRTRRRANSTSQSTHRRPARSRALRTRKNASRRAPTANGASPSASPICCVQCNGCESPLFFICVCTG
jgi:hypothetical protein